MSEDKERREDLPFSRRLATKWLGRQIVFFRELSSTQDEAKKRLFTAPSGLVIWADRQLAGRGRMARPWFSPRGAGLYFSLILKPPLANPLPLYGLATAVGVAEALEKVFQVPFQVKWPNDVLLSGRKVGGILLEAVSSSLIVGVGLNVSLRREDFPPEIREKATSIYEETGLSVSRARILRAILETLEPLYEAVLTAGFEAFSRAWKQRDVTLGARVVLKRPERVITGLSLGPAPDGTLRLKTSGGTVKVHSGEILMWEIPGWESRAA
ncbi:MAG: biotin--[acetyl-CoA-carboxylase] ligase [Thermodesulfobacteria bacterium]|nr:biotin--[acetyl-CoA-carboxylase] ligase [Thermodesulfobacteriota bacterium]